MASNPILPIQSNQESFPLSRSSKTPGGQASFAGLLKEAVAETSHLQKEADVLVEQVARGQSGDLPGTLIALEKAHISFQLMIQVRNKMVEAYQEIMRMQV